ncbi:MAG TPA: LacI family DNA-binding transcriptional regulator [Lacunisphaera sp.]
MRTIARSLGIATSTVSRALRDDATISATVRQQIRRTARSLGYRPNPLVSTLMAQLHVQRRRADPHHIAWIDLWPSDNASAQLLLFNPLLQGARIRARELGYGIEVHKPVQSGIDPSRLRQILLARSQWGIVIPPVPETARHYDLTVEGFAAVTIGTSLHTPLMHRVSPDLYQGGQLACSELRQRGCRRIGLVLTHSMSDRVEGKWLGAYLAEQQQWPAKERLPPLLCPTGQQAAFQRWFGQNKPDAILLAEAQVENWLTKAKPAGGAVVTAWLLLEQKNSRKQGVDYRGEKIGAAAIEVVVGQIHRNERGSPTIPNSLLMQGVWAGGR